MHFPAQLLHVSLKQIYTRTVWLNSLTYLQDAMDFRRSPFPRSGSVVK